MMTYSIPTIKLASVSVVAKTFLISCLLAWAVITSIQFVSSEPQYEEPPGGTVTRKIRDVSSSEGRDSKLEENGPREVNSSASATAHQQLNRVKRKSKAKSKRPGSHKSNDASKKERGGSGNASGNGNGNGNGRKNKPKGKNKRKGRGNSTRPRNEDRKSTKKHKKGGKTNQNLEPIKKDNNEEKVDEPTREKRSAPIERERRKLEWADRTQYEIFQPQRKLRRPAFRKMPERGNVEKKNRKQNNLNDASKNYSRKRQDIEEVESSYSEEESDAQFGMWVEGFNGSKIVLKPKYISESKENTDESDDLRLHTSPAKITRRMRRFQKCEEVCHDLHSSEESEIPFFRMLTTRDEVPEFITREKCYSNFPELKLAYEKFKDYMRHESSTKRRRH